MFLFEIIISPIKLFLELCFDLFLNVIESPAISIIGLSLVVTICCLPLYMIAEKWQEKELADQYRLKNGIKRIKDTFKGDEQYMILSTFYKQNHYNPIYALRSSFGLLIQIPFFMAAYSFLSNLDLLKGCSFLFIKDLGEPDAIFKIKTFTINLLPIAMTLINCVSGAIYSKDHPIREKLQIYFFAAIFLVLLYNSPSGLVIYWTMNNVFSLLKNIFYKIKNPLKVIYITLSAITLCICIILGFNLIRMKTIFKLAFFALFVTVLISPLLIKGFLFIFKKTIDSVNLSQKQLTTIFILSTLILAVTSGFYITSTLINSEPNNFCFVDEYDSPFYFLAVTLFQSIGLYIFWPCCFFFLFNIKVKKFMAYIFSFTAIKSLINCFVFSGNYGSLNQTLTFRGTPDFFINYKTCFVNFSLTIVLLLVLYSVIRYKHQIFNYICFILIFSLTFVGLKNCFSIKNEYNKMEKVSAATTIEPKFHLSKTNNNVIVLFLDQCMSPMIQPVMKEDPNIAKQFDGFVLYPNSVSFAPMTMFGSPGMMGGYDYTPFEFNRRTDQTLQQKHNEAILSLPLLFSSNGYSVTVSDVPYENYYEEPITQIYDDYPQITRTTTKGSYSTIWYKEHNFKDCRLISKFIKRNFLMIGLLKLAPPYLRRIIYHDEFWNLDRDNYSFASFIDSYSTLEYLPKLFDTTAESPTYLFLGNEAIHEPVMLQKPEYVPSQNKTSTKGLYNSNEAQYNSEMAAFKLLGKFMDYLKAQGVYDNTRIVIVSDHGNSAFTSPDFDPRSERIPFNKENLVCTLMFKDFNSHNYKEGNTQIAEDWSFMTNADTGSLATQKIIPGAKNPFTGLSYETVNKLDYIKVSYPKGESTHNRHNLRIGIANDAFYYVDTDVRKDKYWINIDPKEVEREYESYIPKQKK